MPMNIYYITIITLGGIKKKKLKPKKKKMTKQSEQPSKWARGLK